MRDLIQAAFEVQKLLDKQRWKYCFIGGIAVQKWGQVRFTDDIDLTILTGFGNEEEYIDRLLHHFHARVADARAFAIHNRVLLLVDKNRFEIDVSCGAFPFEESAVVRARKVQIKPGIRLKLCSAEDLIVFKAFANRPLDWIDIEGIIAKQSKAKLDWKYINDQLTPLAALKEEPEIVVKLRALADEFP
jgi:predicted nucleotidyltransferase